MQYLRVLIFLWVLSITFATHAFEAFPVRMYVDASRNTAALTITNTKTEDIVVQPQVMLWQQGTGGAEQITKSNDFLVFPTIVQLKPGAKQTIRIRYTGKYDPKIERSYRVIAEQILTKPVEGIVNVAHAMSIPIFVRSTADTPSDLKWTASKTLKNAYEMAAENAGGTHIQITKFSAWRILPDGSKAEKPVEVPLFVYLLPGTKRTIALPTTALSAGSYAITLETDYKPLETVVDLL